MKITKSIGPRHSLVGFHLVRWPKQEVYHLRHPLFATRVKMLDRVQEVAAYSIGSFWDEAMLRITKIVSFSHVLI